MSRLLEGEIGSLRQAFTWACTLDVLIAKPGNVSVASSGHGMEAGQFLASASVAAGAITDSRLGIGARIEAAVQRTHEAVGCNTNLGIVLLCAPLAAACEDLGWPPAPQRLRPAVEQALARLSVADAKAAYRAIALASPGGLGDVHEQDVAQPPTVNLRAAMRLAAMRDMIARQYANGYADIFSFAVPVFTRHLAISVAWPDPLSRPVLATYLALLARFPDSHIVRKHGLATAQSVTRQASKWIRQLESGDALDLPALACWDRELKLAGINPGTSADLTVASAMVVACLYPSLCRNLSLSDGWHGTCISEIEQVRIAHAASASASHGTTHTHGRSGDGKGE